MNQRILIALLIFLGLPGSVWTAQNPALPPSGTAPVPPSTQTSSGQPGSLPPRSNAELQADPTFLEYEKSFIDGKISARQLQKFIRDLRTAIPKIVTNRPPPVEAIKTPLAPAPSTAAPPIVVAAPTAVPLRKPEPENTPRVFDLEDKLNELLQRKAERERPAETNLTTAELMAPGGARTKRQRLDLLLRLFIQEKIPETEYQATREKIMALPD